MPVLLTLPESNAGADNATAETPGTPPMPGFRARVYGGPDDLARGDEVEIIGGLAPVQLFRNDDLPDPRPVDVDRRQVASDLGPDRQPLADEEARGHLDRLVASGDLERRTGE